MASVLAQTIPDFELLIVDDGSTDGTEAYLRSLDDPRVRYFFLPDHPGGNAARNKGIAESTAPLVTFLDSDDEYLPGRLANTLAAFEASPTMRLMISSFETVTPNRRTACTNPAAELDKGDLERAVVSHAVYIAGSAITVRRDLLAEAGGFDVTVRQMQDRDLLLRMSRVSGGLLSPTIDWVKYQSPDSVSGSRNNYIKALATLVQRHPVIAERYGNVLRYLIARHVLKDLLDGNRAAAAAALKTIREFTNLDAGWPRLVSGYVAGKRFRTGVRRSIRRRGTEMTRPSRPMAATRTVDRLAAGSSGVSPGQGVQDIRLRAPNLES